MCRVSVTDLGLSNRQVAQRRKQRQAGKSLRILMTEFFALAREEKANIDKTTSFSAWVIERDIFGETVNSEQSALCSALFQTPRYTASGGKTSWHLSNEISFSGSPGQEEKKQNTEDSTHFFMPFYDDYLTIHKLYHSSAIDSLGFSLALGDFTDRRVSHVSAENGFYAALKSPRGRNLRKISRIFKLIESEEMSRARMARNFG